MLSRNVQTRYEAHQRRLSELQTLANASSAMDTRAFRAQVNRSIQHMEQLSDDVLELALRERKKLMADNGAGAPGMLEQSLLESRFGNLEQAYQQMMTEEYAVIQMLDERRQLYEQLHQASQRADGRPTPLQGDLARALHNTTAVLEQCLAEMDGLATHFRQAYDMEPTGQSLRQLNAAQSIQQALMSDESLTVASDTTSEASIAQLPPTSSSIVTVSTEGYLECKDPVMNHNYRLVTRNNTVLDEHNKTATEENAAFYSRKPQVESLIKATYVQLNQDFIDDVGPSLVTDGQLQLTDGGAGGFQGLCVVSEDGSTRGLSIIEQQAYKVYHRDNLQNVANAVFENTGLKANIRVKAPAMASTANRQADAGLPEAVADDLEKHLSRTESEAYDDTDTIYETLENIDRGDWPETAETQLMDSVQAAEAEMMSGINRFLRQHPETTQNPAHRQAVHQALRAHMDNKRADYGLERHNDTSFNRLVQSTDKPEETPAARQLRAHHQRTVQRFNESDTAEAAEAAEADTSQEHRTTFRHS